MQTTLSYQDRRLVETLCTLRHLPPDFSFPHQMNPEEDYLSQHLLSLSDDEDIFTWLEKYEQIGQIAVRIAIQEVGTLYQHLSIAKKNTSIPDHYHRILGGILAYSEKDFPFNLQGDGEELYNEEIVRHVLLKLQSACQKSSFTSADFRKSNEQEQFLSALLRLPTTTNPFSWTMKNHRHIAIRLVLSHLLHHLTVPPLTRRSLITEPARQTIKIKKKFALSAIDITIENLIVKTEGFLVQVHVNMSQQKLQYRQNGTLSSYIWRGFDHAIDNSGYRYLTWAENVHAGNSNFHSYQEDLILAFYPAITLDTLTITFYSQPVVVEANSIAKDGNRTYLSDILLEDLTWHYDLHNK